MAKTFIMPDSWAADESRRRESDGRFTEVEKNRQLVAEDIGHGRKRWRYKDSAIGIEGSIHHLKGELIRPEKEVPLPGGDIETYVQVIDESGKPKGMMVGHWEKVAEGRHVLRGWKPYRSYG